MKAFIPMAVTDDMLVSSTVAEPATSEPLWNSSTTYAEFDEVSVIGADSHKVYESLQASNLNHIPESSPTWWIEKKYTNRWRMFEWNQGEPTVADSPFSFVIRPGTRIDALALLGLKAATLDMTVRNGVDGPIVFTLDGYLLVRNVSTIYEYLTAEFVYQESVVTFSIPPVPDPVIYITLADPAGQVEVGRCPFGISTYLGKVEFNPISDADNYSQIDWDAFGKATLTPIPSVPISECKLIIPKNRINVVRQFREKANATAVLWSGLDDIENDYTETLILFGVHRKFTIDIGDPNIVTGNLSLKGI